MHQSIWSCNIPPTSNPRAFKLLKMGLSKFLPTMGQNCIQMPQSSTIFYKQFSVWSKNVVKSKVTHSTGSNSPPPHPTHARFKFPTPRAWKTVKFPWVVQGERKNVEASNRLVHKKCIFCFRAERHMYTVPSKWLLQLSSTQSESYCVDKEKYTLLIK